MNLINKQYNVPIVVMTLALGLQPWQGHGKMWVESVVQESHSHSWECKKV
jgi:hypothetical protein